MYTEADSIKKITDNAENIVVLQADNPDADSLGSALALEGILAEMNKRAYLYCAVDMPIYLRYLSGWDRVQKDLPQQFDASIIVDASTLTLFEKLNGSGQMGWLQTKPCIVLDHHETVDNPLPFSDVVINDYLRASTGELIYLLARQLKWQVPADSLTFIMSSILGDTQGLTNQLGSAETYEIMAEIIRAGADRPALEEQRREYSKMPPVIFKYKAELINRTEFSHNGRMAVVTVPQKEINEFSPLYNPAPLVQNDMLQVEGVQAAVVLKSYDDGKITGAIRTNPKAPIAAQLAEQMGGGGHAFASGFKVTGGRSLNEIKETCLRTAVELLDKMEVSR